MAKQTETEHRFVKLYETYIDEVYQFVYLHIGFDRDMTQDLTQEIFLAVFSGMNSFHALCSERTWIFKIARNKLYDYYRKQYIRKEDIIDFEESLSDTICDPKQDIEKFMECRFIGEQVKKTLQSLSQSYRILLILKYTEGKKVKEIAEILGKSPKSIESMIQRARVAFIKAYQNMEDDKDEEKE